jgi:peptidoglycan/xylan/chitin deacetylase (PgdA/CDA1 family)
MAVLVYTAPEQWLWGNAEPAKPAGTLAAGRGSSSTLSTYSAVEFGYRVGLPRLRRIMGDFGLRTTLWVNGTAAEQFGDVLEPFVTEGHELGAHGFSQGVLMSSLARDEQGEAIARSVKALEAVAGVRPNGWLSPAAECRVDTIELLLEHGFDFHCDLQNDELPYFIEGVDRNLVEVPYRLVGNLNDLAIFTRNVNSVSSGADVVIEAFDAYYAEAGRTPLLFNFGTHPYISGRPDTSAAFARVVAHILRHKDVWVTNYGGIATWWRSQFEQDAFGAGGGTWHAATIPFEER